VSRNHEATMTTLKHAPTTARWFMMSRTHLSLPLVSWLVGSLAVITLPAAVDAQAPTPSQQQPAAVPQPDAPAASAASAPEVQPAAQEPAAEPGQSAPAPGATPPVEPAAAPAPPSVAVEPPKAPSVVAADARVIKTEAHVDSSAAAAESADGATLANAGYPLTPGVSSAPIKSEFVLSGFMQAQYESHQDSVDQLRQGGALLNQNRFVLRRGRVKLVRDWDYAQIIVELDGNSVRGPAMRLQKAEASLIYGRSKDKDQPPIVQLTLGQFDLPFGFEMTYVPKVRWFMERTAGSRALWPGEPDMGLRFSGGLGFARYSVAVTNGEPLDGKSGFALQDPNANKDVTARLGAEAKASRSVVLAGGVSFNRGKGFSPGTDATKDMLQFRDQNQDGVAQAIDINGLAGRAAERSQNFSRWAVGADAELLIKSALGWSMLYGEVVAASNLDRGLFIADPVLNGGSAIRELSYYVAFTQEVTQYGVVGFRFEQYNPNADLLDKRAAKLLPVAQHVRTYSPLVGLTLPGRARLVFEWDIIDDLLARDSRGVPTDFKNDQWTLRLQVAL
jgi:hypothetical protein